MASKNAQKLAARLAAVQSLYQAVMNKDSTTTLNDSNIAFLDFDQDATAEIHKDLYQSILNGAFKQSKALENTVQEHFKTKKAEMEPLLKAILICGSYEIIHHADIDNPLIINDYVDIADAFYGKSEKSLVNGVLDSIAKQS